MYLPGGLIRHGTVNLSPPPHQGPDWRYAKFKRFLIAAKKNMGGMDHLVYENVQFIAERKNPKTGQVIRTGFQAVQLWGGFEAITLVWCAERDIPYHPVHTATLKKTVTGKGNSNKEHVVAAIEAAGFTVQSHDEADAVGLALHFKKIIMPEYMAA